MLNKRKLGQLFIISAPSGAGKTTLCRTLMSKMKNLIPSISYTTRPIRADERPEHDYHFIDETAFKRMIRENVFAEWAIVHGHYYGTERSFIEKKMKEGVDIILNIDVQGAKQLKKIYPKAICIFISAPTFQELKKRLLNRKSDSTLTIQKRLKEAKKEVEASSFYEFQVVNDRFERALSCLIDIVTLHRK